MTIEATLQHFKAFNVAEATCSLWVFKKTQSKTNPFKVFCVRTADDLKNELRSIVQRYQNDFTDVEGYELLAQPTENYFFGMNTDGTGFDVLQQLVDAPEEEHLATTPETLKNASGYIFRIKYDNRTLYCVKKTTATWKAKRSRNILNIVFHEQQLKIEDYPVFHLEKNFDFFALDGHLLVANKSAFETLLSFKAKYEEQFAQLQQEAAFVSLFSDIRPLVSFVGTNTTRLRQIAVIHQKGLYRDNQFISRLKSVNEQRGWRIEFDRQNRIVPDINSAKTIMLVLLDHRLHSELSLNIYDVPSATPV